MKLLKKALEKAFNKQCNAISLDGGSFVLDVSKCVPDRVRAILGKHAQIGGPNCYNFALFSVGVLDSLRAVNNQELEDQFFSPQGSICSKVKTKPEPGQIVSLEKRTNDGTKKVHAYVYLTDKYALTKNGPETDSIWEISTLDQINKTYPIDPSEKLVIPYKCTPKPPQGSARPDEIGDFSHLIEKIQIGFQAPSSFEHELITMISKLDLNLTKEKIKFLESTNSIKLYEFFAQFYFVKLYYYHLQETSVSAGESFRSSAEKFLEILGRIFDSTGKEYGLREVANSEDSLEYEYCTGKTSRICDMVNN